MIILKRTHSLHWAWVPSWEHDKRMKTSCVNFYIRKTQIVQCFILRRWQIFLVFPFASFVILCRRFYLPSPNWIYKNWIYKRELCSSWGLVSRQLPIIGVSNALPQLSHLKGQQSENLCTGELVCCFVIPLIFNLLCLNVDKDEKTFYRKCRTWPWLISIFVFNLNVFVVLFLRLLKKFCHPNRNVQRELMNDRQKHYHR